MRLKGVNVAAISLLAAAPTVNAHTWVEFLYHIGSSGTFTGQPGYPIGYLPRSQGITDEQHQTKILDTSTNPAVCKPLSSSNTAQYPPLQAGAGDYIAMQYQENGHVTQPDLTPRPYRGGNVYVYGTMEHQDSDGINDVLNSWTADGKGGNQKGKLIATHYFDDGQCFQDAPGNAIAEERQAKFGVNQLPCQTDLQLPTDLPSTGTYTLMWVWNWPRIISNTQNVTEIYTTCAQINLTASSKSESIIKFSNSNADIQSAAISSQVHSLIEATALGIGTSSPPAPTGLDEATPTASSGASPTSSSSSKSHGHVKTVTVTAEPATVTEYQTVTMGDGDDGDGQTTTARSTAQSSALTTTQPSTFTTATAATTKQTVTSAVNSFPTSLVPVTSVHGFLKVRAARVTGHTRRGFHGY
ncbi:hypothetical protein GGS24DRAFT_457613 [Hypoxylon argillaceum]|nr:hypothetical protein GGS24DRAFT_457613 [Hypoxylon argillaceum]